MSSASLEPNLVPRRAAELLGRIEENVHRVIVGKDRVVRLAAAGLVAVLVEDEVPYLPDRLRAMVEEVVAGSEVIVVSNRSAASSMSPLTGP